MSTYKVECNYIYGVSAPSVHTTNASIKTDGQEA